MSRKGIRGRIRTGWCGARRPRISASPRLGGAGGNAFVSGSGSLRAGGRVPYSQIGCDPDRWPCTRKHGWGSTCSRPPDRSQWGCAGCRDGLADAGQARRSPSPNSRVASAPPGRNSERWRPGGSKQWSCSKRCNPIQNVSVYVLADSPKLPGTFTGWTFGHMTRRTD